MSIFLSNTGDLKICDEQPEEYMTLDEWMHLTPPAAITFDEQHRITDSIEEWKQYLISTDYVSLKLADGDATHEEYAEILAKRHDARIAINVLKAQYIHMLNTHMEG